MWPARSGSNRWPPVLQTGALRKLSYSPNVVLSGPGRSRTDRLRIASAVLSRTELQAQGPAAIAGRRVFNYARTGVNSPERPMRTEWNLTPSPRKEKGPHRAPADRVERIQSVSQELRGCEQRRSQRPTAACWGCLGDGGAGRFVIRRPALRLCTTLSLFKCGAPRRCSVVEEGIEPSRPSRVPVSLEETGALNLSATPPGAAIRFLCG